jgi:hypothetical protein
MGNYYATKATAADVAAYFRVTIPQSFKQKLTETGPPME